MWSEVVVRGTKQGAEPSAGNLAPMIVTASGPSLKKDRTIDHIVTWRIWS